MLIKIFKDVLLGSAKKHLTITGIVPAGVAVVGDLFEPIWKYSVLSFGVFAFLLALAITLVWERSRRYANWPPDPHALNEDFEGPGLLLTVSLVGMLFAAGIQIWRLAAETASDQSVVAEHFSVAKSIQVQLGIANLQLASVGQELHTISAEAKASRETLGKIVEGAQSISSAINNVKKETSSDPRKELANIGVEWSTDSFTDAILRADMKVLELFLAGGMNLLNPHNGASLAVYALQPGVPERVEIMKLFMRHGFKLDTELIDTRIMATRRSLPYHFEHPKLSEKYGAWNKTFAGSALFWIVCITAYEGASPEDYELIKFLVASGADTTLSREYMMLPVRTTPVEKELRTRLERFITAHR